MASTSGIHQDCQLRSRCLLIEKCVVRGEQVRFGLVELYIEYIIKYRDKILRVIGSGRVSIYETRSNCNQKGTSYSEMP